MSKDPHNIQFTLTTLSGDRREYNLVPLVRREASYVSYTFLQTITKGVAHAVKGSKGGEAQAALVEYIGSIPHAMIWELASIIFKDAVVKTDSCIIDIHDLEDCDLFTENPDELPHAVFRGVAENFPKFFTRIRGVIKDLNIKIPEGIKSKLAIFISPSEEKPSKPSKSPSGTE